MITSHNTIRSRTRQILYNGNQTADKHTEIFLSTYIIFKQLSHFNEYRRQRQLRKDTGYFLNVAEANLLLYQRTILRCT